MCFKQLATREASLSYIAQLTASIPPRPVDMDRIVATNITA